MPDTAQRIAEVCAKICESNKHWSSAKEIRKQFYLNESTQTCVLLTQKEKNEDSTN